MQGLIKSSYYRACIASVMIMVNLVRAVGVNPDDSYINLWMRLWVLVEVSIGVSITGTFSLPKFIEAEGPKLRGVFLRLTRPLTFRRRSRIPAQWKKDERVTSQEGEPDDTFAMNEYSSERNLVASTNQDRDVERCPSYEDVHGC